MLRILSSYAFLAVSHNFASKSAAFSSGLGSKTVFSAATLLFELIRCDCIDTFYFLITYEVFKKRKYCNRMSEKKILSF